MARNVTVGLIQCATRVRPRTLAGAEDQERRAREAPPAHRGGGQEGRADPRAAGDLQRPVLLPGARPALVRRGRGRARPDRRAACRRYAKKYQMAMVVPVYEREQAGVYYNTAAVIDADGTYLGKYRKNHIPQTSGFWEKYFFKPGNLGYPTFQTRYAKIGVYICYDRHFPEGARAPRAQRRGDRVQPVGDGRGPLAVLVEARAAGARGGQRLLRRRVEPRRHRGAVEHREVLRHELLRRSARQLPRRRRARTRTSWSSPTCDLEHDRGGPDDLAVLSRPPPRDATATSTKLCIDRERPPWPTTRSPRPPTSARSTRSSSSRASPITTAPTAASCSRAGKDCASRTSTAQSYLDFFGGILTLSLGHANERVNARGQRADRSPRPRVDALPDAADRRAGGEARLAWHPAT